MTAKAERLTATIRIAEAHYFFNSTDNTVGQKLELDTLRKELANVKDVLADFQRQPNILLPDFRSQPSAPPS